MDNITKILQNIFIITGLSGAGKSTALRVFEDLNYFVVDGLPASMAPDMIEMMRKPSMSHFKGIAFGMDMRQEDFLTEYEKSIKKLASSGIIPNVLFLEADDKILFQRYAATRRPHPMEREGIALEAAITLERNSLAPLRKIATEIIDSSNYSIHDLRRVIQSECKNPNSHNLRVNIISFGFKHGIPNDADIIFDLRFLPNPYFIEELRSRDGRDKMVSEYIFSHSRAKLLRDKLFDLLTLMLSQMEDEGRYRVTIALGCTGGKHRSVAFVQDIGTAIAQMDYPVLMEHRHINLD